MTTHFAQPADNPHGDTPVRTVLLQHPAVAHVMLPKRADARRNALSLVEAAAVVFVTAGVDAPIRDIAAKAGVGTATIYRHFPRGRT